MARRIRVYTVDDLAQEIDTKLHRFRIETSHLSLREKVLQLADIHYDCRCLGVSVAVECGLPRASAIDRIQVYLQRHVGIPIDSVELDVVAGISDYPRRIRQLRVERGFRIVTGASPDEDSEVILKPDEYMLVSVDMDTDAARRWHIVNRIRRSGGSSKQRIITFLLENVGQVVTTEELAYVAKEKKEFARRVRELRTEDGFAIATKNTGRPDLRVGEYVLLSEKRVAEPHDRHTPIEVQRAVYARDNNTCRNPQCMWNMSRWTTEDPRILELHHLVHHAKRGPNTAENLILLCSSCHDDVHAERLDILALL